MSFYTGRDGYVILGTKNKGKIQSWSITASAQLNDNTKIGDCNKQYTPGAVSYQGNVIMWYYNDATEAWMDRLFRTGGPQDAARMQLGWGNKSLIFDAFITNSTITCQAGAIMEASVDFVVDGDLIRANT